MSIEDPTHVSDFLTTVLDNLVTIFQTGSRPVDRAVIFPGQPAWDCEQLAIWPRLRVATAPTTTSSNKLGPAFAHVLDIGILLNRCIVTHENNTIPTMETVTLDGVAYATDMWLLQRAVTNGVKDGTLLGDMSCRSVKANPVLPALPQGGFSAMTTTIEVTL